MLRSTSQTSPRLGIGFLFVQQRKSLGGKCRQGAIRKLSVVELPRQLVDLPAQLTHVVRRQRLDFAEDFFGRHAHDWNLVENRSAAKTFRAEHSLTKWAMS